MEHNLRRSRRRTFQVQLYTVGEESPEKAKRPRSRDASAKAARESVNAKQPSSKAKAIASRSPKESRHDDDSDDNYEEPTAVDRFSTSTVPRDESIAPDPRFAMGNRHATDYFSSRKIRKKSKDDKKAAALAQLDADEVRDALRAWDATCKDSLVPKQLALYSNDFGRWEHQLFAGFNLLFTGLGSKLQLLQRFAAHLNSVHVLQIHGYLPSVSIRYVVTTLFTNLFKKKPQPNRSLEEQCLECVHRLHTTTPAAVSVCLVVHSIDGISLRGPDTQRALSILAACHRIHVAASIDHVNAASLWEESDIKRFGWLEQRVHTYAPYTHETLVATWGHRGKAGGGVPTALSGVKYILESLTPTDLGVLRALGTEQLANGGAMVDQKQFVDLCRKKMLVSSVQAMRNAIACLKEHGLVVTNKADQLRVPFSDLTIQHTILGQTPIDAPDEDKDDDGKDPGDPATEPSASPAD